MHNWLQHYMFVALLGFILKTFTFDGACKLERSQLTLLFSYQASDCQVKKKKSFPFLLLNGTVSNCARLVFVLLFKYSRLHLKCKNELITFSYSSLGD